MLRTALIWGILAGVIMISPWFLFSPSVDDFDPTEGMILGFSLMIIGFGSSYFGVKAFRERSEKWSFGRAWGTSLSIAFIGMCVYVGGWMIYNNMHPEFIQEMFSNSIEEIQNNAELTDNERTEQLATIQWQQEVYESPIAIALITFTEPLIPAIVLSLIVGLVLRKPKDEEENLSVIN